MINSKLLGEIKLYCEMNGVDDVNAIVNKMLQRGFTIEKYGETPVGNVKSEKKDLTPNKYVVELKTVEDKIVEEIKIIKPKIKGERDLYGE